jgi:hypothetical protein
MNIRRSDAWRMWVLGGIGVLALSGAAPGSPVWAQGQQALDGSKIPKAIEGFDEQKVKEDPICDSSRRPHILKIEPDEMKIGDTILITGKDFGRKKECFQGVFFGSERAKSFTYIDEEKVEATVPDTAPSGLTFLNVVTSGGANRKGILVK